MNKMVERRKHKRFTVSNGAFVVLRPHQLNIGQLLDISMGGLAFTYMADQEPPNRSYELDMFFIGESFYLEGAPIRIAWDCRIDGVPFSSLKMRRMGVQFGELTPGQKSQLHYFIENYNTDNG